MSRTKKLLFPALAALLLCARMAPARADDDDDDPKASAHVVAPAKQHAAPPAPVAKPAAPVAKPAAPVAKPAAPVAKPAAPVAKPAAPVAKPAAPAAKPAAPVAKPAAPAAKPAAPVAKPESRLDAPKPSARAEKRAEKPEPPAIARVEKPAHKGARSETVLEDVAEAKLAPAARTVRVRLLDGSTVIGTVRAELSESLVIDCNLGLLSIPRARIALIAYDASGGAKRAPVQQLDDDLPSPHRR